MPEQIFKLNRKILNHLDALHAESKFEAHGPYPGAPSKEIQRTSEQAVNLMLSQLRAGLPKSPQKSYVISEFLQMLKAFEDEGTEEREQACGYCERVMEILGIESSDGVLNNWLYGFDPEQ